ncbi:hypothetical protein Q763_16390 [Flavobacterium beibuense F44-8]|uniref:Lipocalin-like domain-containing protein n=1 Tax=Flavobacterium beibuense F44-8 TaxID=1406840 RepID=A0A0A2LI12_9FLAO|nr:hypothetical protein [Flavobacterium beibuense]KGO78861.1 hypothetical protein Q763_16390 [Flavobacterium beibuense F44-8]
MKKLNHTLLKTFAVFTVLFMVACSNDDDTTANNDTNVIVDPEEEIPVDPFIGNWKSLGYYVNDEYFENEDCENVELNINDENTGTMTYHDCGWEDESENLTWEKLEENKYKITIPDDTATLNTVFENDLMKVTVEGEEDYIEVFQKQ